jgi:hypothetical protein
MSELAARPIKCTAAGVCVGGPCAAEGCVCNDGNKLEGDGCGKDCLVLTLLVLVVQQFKY